MTAPALSQFANGLSQVSGYNLETFAQTCNIVSDLRGFVGAAGIQVYLRGYTAVNDGGQGFFYWNSSGTGPDDGGVTNIVPNGATTGCWTRLSTTTGANLVTQSTSFAPNLASAGYAYLATTTITISLPLSTTLSTKWYFDVDAQGGNVTLTPQSTDKINGITAGTSFVLPLGTSARVYTDANGNFWLFFNSTNPAFGECQFQLASSTSCKLVPWNGNKVSFPFGIPQSSSAVSLPSAGITTTITSCYLNGSSGQSLSPATLYYAYLAYISGNYVIDWSTTAHGVDSNTGIVIKAGDATRVLVGMVYTQSGPTVADSGNLRYVASWFNRQPKVSSATFTTNHTTTSNSLTEINSEIECGFLTWGDGFTANSSQTVLNTSGSAFMQSAIYLNQGIALATVAANVAGANLTVNLSNSVSYSTSEGDYYVTIFGSTGAGTAQFNSGGALQCITNI